MGPGGLRGLQILRSGASRVRGGFDSHAFPPLRRALLGGLLAGALGAASPPPAGAQAADTSAVEAAPEEEAAGDSAAAPGAAPRRSAPAAARGFDTPRWVMLRSLAVPGWGQLHNGSWLKALAVAGAEAGLAVRLLDDRRTLDDLERQIDAAAARGDVDLEDQLIERYNARLDRFTARQWLLGGVVLYALLDAYIDAHFRYFSVEFGDDPALPEGAAPRGGARLALRMAF